MRRAGVGIGDAAHQGADQVAHQANGRGSVFTQAGQGECGVCQHGGIVGAGDGDGDGLGGAVGTDGGEAVGVVGARHELVLRRVHGVAPDTSGVDAELAPAVGPCGVGLCSESRSAVHVGQGQRSPCRLGGVAFGQAGRAHAADDGSVVRAREGDGDRLGGAVGTNSCEAVGVIAACHELILRRVHGVAPHTRRGQAEFAIAVAACGIRLRTESGGAVRVGDRQRAAGGQGHVGLGQAGGVGATDHGRVVGARERDGDDLGRAVGCFGGVAVGIGLACDKLVVRRVHRVGPHASAVDAEHTEVVVASDVGLDLEGGSTVHVADGQRARGALDRVAFGQSSGAHTGDDSGVVGAVDGDRDGLRGAVGRDGGEAVGVGLPSHQRVVRGVHGVGPRAAGGQREGAVGIVARRARLGRKSGGAVDVADGQCAAGALRSVGFGQGGGGDTPNDCRIVGAGDRHSDELGGAIGTDGGEAVGVGLTAHERVLRRVHDISPHACAGQAELAPAAGACGVGLCRENLLANAILVGDAERAGGSLCRVGLGQRLGGGAANHSRVVHVGHADGHRLIGEAARAVGGAHGDVVHVVGTRIGGGLKVGRGHKAQRARAGVDAELGRVHTTQAVAQGAARLGGLRGVDRGGCGRVFSKSSCDRTGEHGGRQDVDVQRGAWRALVACSIGEREGQGLGTGGERAVRRQVTGADVVGGSGQHAVDIELGRVDKAGAHLHARRGVVGGGR